MELCHLLPLGKQWVSTRMKGTFRSPVGSWHKTTEEGRDRGPCSAAFLALWPWASHLRCLPQCAHHFPYCLWSQQTSNAIPTWKSFITQCDCRASASPHAASVWTRQSRFFLRAHRPWVLASMRTGSQSAFPLVGNLRTVHNLNHESWQLCKIQTPPLFY